MGFTSHWISRPIPRPMQKGEGGLCFNGFRRQNVGNSLTHLLRLPAIRATLGSPLRV
jgi:hypothetical protein